MELTFVFKTKGTSRLDRGHDDAKTCDALSRKIYPGGVGFETSSTRGGRGVVLVVNLTRPVLHRVSVLVIGNWLGFQISKLDDKTRERERARTSRGPWLWP